MVFLNRLKIAILFGGASFEHEVSLQSAYNVIKNLKEEYYLVPIGITKTGNWFYYDGDIEKIKSGQWEKENCPRVVVGMDKDGAGILKFEENGKIDFLEVDCFFAVLHGQNGEDGKMQSIFEMNKVPYVGCNSLSSMICMNKVLTRTILDKHGIKGTKWIGLKKNEIDDLEEKALEIAKYLKFPIFTKPASCGSSVGIKKCKDLQELKKGILYALEFEDELICEAFVNGKEVECAVLGGKSAKASVVGQIISYGEFYDYDSKYKEDSKLLIPADVNDDVAKKIKQIAVKVFKIMGCYGLSRVDFFVDADDEIFLNEINTMPGFTDISMYPMLWKKSGISYKELLKILIDLAMERG